MLGDINSITVAIELVIKEYIIIVSIVNGACTSGMSKPNRKKERKHNKNEKPKNVSDPSSVRFELVQERLILIFPQRFPITEAIVSAIIIINMPAIGK